MVIQFNLFPLCLHFCVPSNSIKSGYIFLIATLPYPILIAPIHPFILPTIFDFLLFTKPIHHKLFGGRRRRVKNRGGGGELF